MKTINACYITMAFFVVLCHSSRIFCKEIDVPAETEQLRSFLLKGYASAKSILEDVKIEYKMTQIPINPIPLDPAFLKKLNMKEQPDIDILRFTHVQEYIQKNGKERWVFLHYGKSSPTEDVSYKTGLIGTENSPRFIVFDGQNILDYQPVSDGFTNVGRATIKAGKTALFETYGSRVHAPVQFFGYYPGLMPDDVLSNPQLKIQTKPEKISDLLTYKISAPIQINNTKYNMVYWLAPERSCLPVKIEVERNGRFNRRLEVKDFFKLEDGRWAIKSILQRNFVHKGECIENINLIYTMRKLELHPEIDEDKIFSTSPDHLPEGVHVMER
jgi:hypothetical protein